MKKAATFKQRFLLLIEPYIYICIDGISKVMLYNEHINKKLISNEPSVYDLIIKLDNTDNFRIIEITQEELSIKEIQHFIDQGRKNYILDIIPKEFLKTNPVQFIPKPLIRTQRDRFKEYKEMHGDDVLHNITELFFLFGKYRLERENSNLYKLQAPYYYNTNCNIDITLKEFKDLFYELEHSSLFKIHFIGDSILNDSKYSDLLNFILELDLIIEFYINAAYVSEELLDKMNRFSSVYSKVKFNIIISDFSLKNKFYKLLDNNKVFHFIFILKNETELSQVNNFIEKEEIESYKLLPIFTGENISFFKKNVFTSLSDLNELNPSQLDLYRNHKINSLFFGKLYISSSGDISSNIASPIIGKLGKTSINQIVLEEILNSRNWLSLRSDVEPCKNCIYCDFCPPLSNYEKAIGKNNLCNIL